MYRLANVSAIISMILVLQFIYPLGSGFIADAAGVESAMFISEMPQSPAPVTQEEIGDVSRKDSMNYKRFFEISTEGPVIPGLRQDYIPQGLAYDLEKNWMLISYYRKDGGPSMLSIVDLASGRMVKALLLYKDANTPYTEHAAGVAISSKHAWIASGRSVYQFKLEDIENAPHMGKLMMSDTMRTETLGGFLSIANGVLWVGEFARYDYVTDVSHHMINRNGEEHSAWVSGYRLNDDDTLNKTKIFTPSNVLIPDYILSVPDEIQGMAMFGDHVILSKSYGISNDSDFLSYRFTLKEAPHAQTKKFGTDPVPVWFLDDLNLANSMMAPPMSEGIFEHGGKLYSLFESGATAYLNSDYPLDKIFITDTDLLLSGPPPLKTEPGRLLITEAVIDSADTGSAFSYIELYNDSGQPIDLSDHRIYYYYEPKYAEPWKYGVDKLLIHSAGRAADTVIPSYSTKIIWILTDPNKTVQDFNRAYGTNMNDDKFVYVTNAGFSYTGQRFLAIVGPRGDKIHDRYTFVRYNADAGTGKCARGKNCDLDKGESIVYYYPDTLDWSSRELVRKVPESLHQRPTPGDLLPGQVPPMPVPPNDLQVQAWDQSVFISWDPVPGPSSGYKIYVEDQTASRFEASVAANTYDYRLGGLENNRNYKIHVTTLRKALLPGKFVESVKSPDLFVTPMAVNGLTIGGLPAAGRAGQSYPTVITATYNGVPVFPVKKNLYYKSSNNQVASVSPEGIIFASNPGTTVITVKVEGITGRIRFNVSNGRNGEEHP